MLAWKLESVPGEYSYGSVDIPDPVADQVQVKIVASSVNHIDHWLSQGRPKPKVMPHVPGCDGAGIVTAVGDDVTGLSVGDEVVINVAQTDASSIDELGIDSVLSPSLQIIGEHVWGCHGELVTLPARNVVQRPQNRTWEECAAYGVVTGTAWRMLRRARLTPDSVVLITGIGGGVAMGCFHIAKHFGAKIYVTSRDSAKRERAIEAGAVDAFDSSGDYPIKADIICDSIGGDVWQSSARALKPGGRFVTCGATAGQTLEVAIPRLFFKQHEIIGSTLHSYEEFDYVTQLMGEGLGVEVDSVFALDEYPLAMERIRSGKQFGKIVLRHDVATEGK